MSNGFALPGISHRTAVIGRTGGGKTFFGVWLLSEMPFDKMPWIIFDFKGDDLINAIGAREISIKSDPPIKPGLYVVRPHPAQDALVDVFLWKVWQNGNTGLYFDEGYMVAGSDAYSAIQTQGRSLCIPSITLTQRPVWANKFSFSEADYFCIFQLNKKDDNKMVANYTADFDFREELPKYYSRWYDVSQGKFYVLKPVPSRSKIISNFNMKLSKERKFI